jgi:hypothetical protein
VCGLILPDPNNWWSHESLPGVFLQETPSYKEINLMKLAFKAGYNKKANEVIDCVNKKYMDLL